MIAEINGGDIGGAIFVLMLLAVVIPLALAAFAFWIWMLISAIQNKGLSEGEKIAWLLVMVFVYFFGVNPLFLCRPSETEDAAGTAAEAMKRRFPSRDIFSAGKKRWRATAVQDAGARLGDSRLARSVLECASPLAL
jgi:hypothetical protein